MKALTRIWKYQIAAFHDRECRQIREVRYAPDKAAADRVKRDLIDTYPTSPVTMEKLK